MELLSIPVLGFAVLSVLALYKIIIFPGFISPLSKIPNAHWSSPYSAFWILWTRYHCHENRSVNAAHLKHGPVVRLGPNELSVNDVGGLRTVYAGGFEKGQWYSIFDNYGYVWHRIVFYFPKLTEKCALHVFFLAFPSTLGQKTHDLEYLLEVKYSHFACFCWTSKSHSIRTAAPSHHFCVYASIQRHRCS